MIAGTLMSALFGAVIGASLGSNDNTNIFMSKPHSTHYNEYRTQMEKCLNSGKKEEYCEKKIAKPTGEGYETGSH